MGFGIDGSSNANGKNAPGLKIRAQSAAGGSGPTPGIVGDSLQLGGNTKLVEEVQKMTPAQAESSRKVGSWAVGGGLLAVAAAYWGAPVLAGLVGGSLLLPVGLAAIGICAGLWGAMKLGKGISASLSQKMAAATKGLPE